MHGILLRYSPIAGVHYTKLLYDSIILYTHKKAHRHNHRTYIYMDILQLCTSEILCSQLRKLERLHARGFGSIYTRALAIHSRCEFQKVSFVLIRVATRCVYGY